MKTYTLILLCSLLAQTGLGQTTSKDTTSTKSIDSDLYFEDLTHLFAIRLYTLTKLNSLEIRNDLNKILLRPNGQTNLGVGFNYKWIGIGLAFGLPLSQPRIDKYGKTTRFDLQFSAFSKWFGADGFIQDYRGYYLVNPEDFVDWQQTYRPQIPDMRIFSMGGSAFYIFNKKRFSYKAAHVKTQIQKKSAGSFTMGIFAYYDKALSDNGFIPSELPDSIRTDIDLKEFDMISGGLSVGYMHSFVIKKNFTFNISLVPGFGIQKVSTTKLNGNGGIQTQPAGQFLLRASLGYEFKWFYMGLTGSVIYRNFSYKEYTFDLGTEQFRFFIGKRFDVSRK